jgi:uncharacterized membrane protein YfcA
MSATLLILIPVGLATGVLGTVSGAGSLLSFPILLALGYSPLEANTTNTVGMVLTNVGASFGFQREIRNRRHLALGLTCVGAAGGLLGALLLLWLGNAVFKALVPWLLLFASALVLMRPLLLRSFARGLGSRRHHWMAVTTTVVASVYGGYFGAGMGIMLVGAFGVLLGGRFHEAIALKSIVALAANLVAVAVFMLWAPVAYPAAAVLGASTIAGGYVGSHVARHLPDRLLQGAAVCVGVASAVYAARR